MWVNLLHLSAEHGAVTQEESRDTMWKALRRIQQTPLQYKRSVEKHHEIKAGSKWERGGGSNLEDGSVDFT